MGLGNSCKLGNHGLNLAKSVMGRSALALGNLWLWLLLGNSGLGVLLGNWVCAEFRNTLRALLARAGPCAVPFCSPLCCAKPSGRSSKVLESSPSLAGSSRWFSHGPWTLRTSGAGSFGLSRRPQRASNSSEWSWISFGRPSKVSKVSDHSLSALSWQEFSRVLSGSHLRP